MTEYSKGSHTVYHHRYHIVWITKYRYRVLQGELRLRVRTITSDINNHTDAHQTNNERNLSLD
jgi:putative transposase